MKAKTVASTVITLLWLTGSSIAFWWFSLQHQSNFAENYVYFNGEQLAGANLSANSSGPTLLHFIDTNCPCSRFALPHIQQLQAQFNHNAMHYVWPNRPPSLTEQLPVPASPAVAIWDQKGQLAYFGPYSGGAFCGRDEDFVQSTLSQLKQNKNPRWINHDVFGCYCPWQPTEEINT